MRVLIDTSILVRLRDRDSPARATCERCIRQLRYQADELYLCTQVLIEFWSVATRPINTNGLGMSSEQAFQDCRRFLVLADLLPEPEDILDRWLDIVRRYEVRGKQVHDARLVALASAYGIPQILTLNPQDFARYNEVTAILPEDVLC